MPEAALKLLVIEGDPVLCDLIVLTLQRLASHYSPCQVLSADDGALALNVARREQPHLFVIDLFLPDMNGLDLIQQLKSAGFLTRAPAIVLSALGYREIVQQVVGAGANDFLVKPLNLDLLCARVQSHLDRMRGLSNDARKSSAP